MKNESVNRKPNEHENAYVENVYESRSLTKLPRSSINETDDSSIIT